MMIPTVLHILLYQVTRCTVRVAARFLAAIGIGTDMGIFISWGVEVVVWKA